MSSPPTTNAVLRTLKLRSLHQEGTAFLIDHEQKRYLLTANHLLPETGSVRMELFIRSTWLPFDQEVLVTDTENDVAVLTAPFDFPTLSTLKLPIGLDGSVFGQDMYFLGFPFGLYGSFPMTGVPGLNDWVWPYIKKAALSSICVEGNQNRLALDGINNVGFSGGPVVFQHFDTKDFCLAGIVTGYREEERMLHISGSNGETQSAFYAQNTGLIYATSAKRIRELIEQTPNGRPIIDGPGSRTDLSRRA